MSLNLYCLNKWYLMNLCLYSNLWYNNWNFYVFLNLSYFNSRFINNFRNLYLNNLNLFNNFQNLFYYFNLCWRFLNYFLNSYDLLHYLWNLNNFFLNMINWDYFFNILFNNLNSSLYMWNNFWNFLIPYHLYNFFNYLRNTDNFFFFNYLFDDFFNKNLNLFNYFSLSLKVANNLFNYLYSLKLFLNNYLIFFNDNRLLNLDYSLNKPFFRLQFCFFANLNGHSLIKFRMRNHF